MEGETFDSSLRLGMVEHVPQTFHHEDENERGQRVSLPYASRGVEGFEGDAIDKNEEEGNSNEVEDPYFPGVIESKRKQGFLNEDPVQFVEGI